MEGDEVAALDGVDGVGGGIGARRVPLGDAVGELAHGELHRVVDHPPDGLELTLTLHLDARRREVGPGEHVLPEGQHPIDVAGQGGERHRGVDVGRARLHRRAQVRELLVDSVGRASAGAAVAQEPGREARQPDLAGRVVDAGRLHVGDAAHQRQRVVLGEVDGDAVGEHGLLRCGRLEPDRREGHGGRIRPARGLRGRGEREGGQGERAQGACDQGARDPCACDPCAGRRPGGAAHQLPPFGGSSTATVRLRAVNTFAATAWISAAVTES